MSKLSCYNQPARNCESVASLLSVFPEEIKTTLYASLNDAYIRMLHSTHCKNTFAACKSNIRANRSVTAHLDLDRLVKWSEKWQMLFNFGKCKCLYTGHRNLNVNYKMGDTVLGTTVKEKDLRSYNKR